MKLYNPGDKSFEAGVSNNGFFQRQQIYAGISLTGYHPSPPGTPGLLHRNVYPA